MTVKNDRFFKKYPYILLNSCQRKVLCCGSKDKSHGMSMKFFVQINLVRTAALVISFWQGCLCNDVNVFIWYVFLMGLTD